MSLLIKALQKAEDDKKTDVKNKASASTLSLEPPTQPSPTLESNTLEFTTESPKPELAKNSGVIAESLPQETKVSQQQSASNLFEAKNSNTKKGSRPIVLAGLALGFLMIGVGGFYYYLESLNPNQLAAKNPTPSTPSTPPAVIASADTNNNNQATPVLADAPLEASTDEQVRPEVENETETVIAPVIEPKVVEAKPVSQKTSSHRYAFGDELQPLADSNSLKITRKQADNGVNPSLLAAYNAFNAGDDATAQQLYRNVLQSDIRNIDALLGMAAISSRQGRLNDANGWYAKVLEIEPRNSYALAAVSDLASQTDPVSAESRIKNMLAQQPQAAHLHAALGQLYLDQSNWAAAQQAFFEAHHFAPNQADYAYNLAICLDQMGKGQLALPYYRKALMLAKSGPNSIDGNALESRIQALQAE